MEQDFTLTATGKAARYREFLEAYTLFITDEHEPVSLMANTAAALKEAFGFFWVGFYQVKGEELILGPFQGSPACWRIRKGRGVCGTAWAEGRTLVVPDVDQFPGHIACSSLSRSEIVVPYSPAGGSILGVLDIDSDRLSAFDDDDRRGLEAILSEMMKHLQDQ
jgi:GAF domain-containing protein